MSGLGWEQSEVEMESALEELERFADEASAAEEDEADPGRCELEWVSFDGSVRSYAAAVYSRLVQIDAARDAEQWCHATELLAELVERVDELEGAVRTGDALHMNVGIAFTTIVFLELQEAMTLLD